MEEWRKLRDPFREIIPLHVKRKLSFVLKYGHILDSQINGDGTRSWSWNGAR